MSGRMASSSESAAWYVLRSTAAQQAGLVPRFLQRVLPQVPSHMLPAPAKLFEDFIKVFGKPLDAKPQEGQQSTI